MSVEFAPIHDVRFRASYNRAVRAPNIVELFAPQVVGLGGTVDPCAGAGTPTARQRLTAAQCAFTGVTAAQYGNIAANPANQYNALFGGNLEPDCRRRPTPTLSVSSFSRVSIPGLAFTVDYFDIKIEEPDQHAWLPD